MALRSFVVKRHLGREGSIDIEKHVPSEIGDLLRSQTRSDRQQEDRSVADAVSSASEVVQDSADLVLVQRLRLLGESHHIPMIKSV